MKWVALDERNPPNLLSINYYYTDNIDIWQASYIPSKATHWLEFDIPPLPEKEKYWENDLIKDINNMNFNVNLKACLFQIIEILKTKADK